MSETMSDDGKLDPRTKGRIEREMRNSTAREMKTNPEKIHVVNAVITAINEKIIEFPGVASESCICDVLEIVAKSYLDGCHVRLQVDPIAKFDR